MSEGPLISVIVPVFNVERYLDKCVQSIIDQSYRNLEIILVDDGSTDHCPEKCDSWRLKDPRIKVVHKENGGLSDARNVGLSKVTGDYISFVDSDDWLHPHFIQYLYQASFSTNADVSCCAVYRRFSGEEEKSFETLPSVQILSKELAQQMGICRNGIDVYVWNKLYTKDVLSGLIFPQGKLHEDILYTYQALERATAIAYLELPLYNYRCNRKDSILKSRFSIKRLDAIEMRVQRLHFIEIDHPSMSFLAKQELITKCCYNMREAWIALPESRKSVFLYLSSVLSRLDLTREEWKQLKFSHKAWTFFAKVFSSMLKRFKSIDTCA